MKHKELLTTYLVLTSTAAKELEAHSFHITKYFHNQSHEIIGGFVSDDNGAPAYKIKLKKAGTDSISIGALCNEALAKYTAIREAIAAWEHGEADFPFDLVKEW